MAPEYAQSLDWRYSIATNISTDVLTLKDPFKEHLDLTNPHLKDEKHIM